MGSEGSNPSLSAKKIPQAFARGIFCGLLSLKHLHHPSKIFAEVLGFKDVLQIAI